eukprot:659262-Pyramimonas_sp.AAC.1
MQNRDEVEEAIRELENPKREGQKLLIQRRAGLAEVQRVQERGALGAARGDREHPGRGVESDDVLTEVAARYESTLARGGEVQGGSDSAVHRGSDELDITIPKTEDAHL